MNMSCANHACKAELKYLRGGRLFLMERQPNLPHSDSYDPSRLKRPVTMRRYFWLCESCTETYTIRQWTDAGIQLAVKPKARRAVNAAMYSRDWMMPGLVG